MSALQQTEITSAENFEESIREEIDFYSNCLDGIREKEGSIYTPIGIIYESLLAHRRRQLSKMTANGWKA